MRYLLVGLCAALISFAGYAEENSTSLQGGGSTQATFPLKGKDASVIKIEIAPSEKGKESSVIKIEIPDEKAGHRFPDKSTGTPSHEVVSNEVIDVNITSQKGVEHFVKELNDGVFGIINSETIVEDVKVRSLAKMFRQYVDTDWMARFVMGRYYKQMDPEEAKRYLEIYREYLIYSYVPSFQEYAAKSYEILRVIYKGSDEAVVQVKLSGVKDKAADIRVDYRLRKVGDNFKIADIIGEGVSLITTQRSDFGGLVARKGVAYFLDRLENKVTEMMSQNKDMAS